jgi:HSP20 family protein
MAKKRSFFERLTGGVEVEDELDEEDEEQDLVESSEEMETEGQLSVDVHQTPNDIVIRSMVAGVRPEDLDISITRDMVTIRGKREESKEIREDDYVYRELYWGSFSRSISLPQEIDPDGAEASEKFGLLTIKLPKLNKDKQTKVKVRSSN